jgi:hypothetical protein
MRTKWALAAVVACAVIAGAALAFSGYHGTGPFASTFGVSVKRVAPEAFATPGESADPLVIAVLFHWPDDGFCSGQFSVSATETAEEVRVSDVTSREYRGGGGCAGLGTVSGMAGAELTLAAPLGTRKLVRASDGTVLVAASQ